MNVKLKLALMTAALLAFIGSSTGMTQPNARPQQSAQTRAKKSAPSATAVSQASPASGCSLLTPAMIKKVVGRTFQAGTPQKTMPMYGGAWGWSCQYFSRVDQRDARVDFIVFAEASAAKAKEDFDTLGIGADSSGGKPSIGDSSYWFTNDKQEPRLFVLKGKVHFSLGMIPTNEKQLKDLAAAVAAGI